MIKQILSLLSPYEKRKSWLVIGSVLLRAMLDFAGVAALIPVLVMVMGDNPDRPRILLLCIGILIFVLLKNAVVILLTRFQSRFLLSINKRLSEAMFCQYYKRGLLFLKSKSSVQLGYEVNFISYMFSLSVLAPLLRIVSEATLLVLLIVALMVFSPFAGMMLCAIIVPLIACYAFAVKRKISEYGKEELLARRTQSRLVVEAFRGYSEMEISQAFEHSLSAFRMGLDKIIHCRMRYETVQQIPMFLSESSIVLGIAILLLSTQGDLRVISGVFAVAAYRMIPSARNLLNSWNSIQNASHAIQTVTEGIAETADVTDDDNVPLVFEDCLETRHVSFTFPDGAEILSDLSIKIKKGERLGIQGASGSGKSTLFNLLLGFYPPTSGEICVDGMKLTMSNRPKWHKIVGYVPQDIFIIKGTLAENVALGMSDIDRDKVLRVLKQVHLDEWLATLPEGIDSELGEYGSRMSGGQKQRIGIARALYKDAEVLFFDEATSSLDNETEREITNALEELSGTHRELTLIIIAHRDSSLRFCDRIIDLEEMR